MFIFCSLCRGGVKTPESTLLFARILLVCLACPISSCLAIYQSNSLLTNQSDTYSHSVKEYSTAVIKSYMSLETLIKIWRWSLNCCGSSASPAMDISEVTVTVNSSRERNMTMGHKEACIGNLLHSGKCLTVANVIFLS